VQHDSTVRPGAMTPASPSRQMAARAARRPEAAVSGPRAVSGAEGGAAASGSEGGVGHRCRRAGPEDGSPASEHSTQPL